MSGHTSKRTSIVHSIIQSLTHGSDPVEHVESQSSPASQPGKTTKHTPFCARRISSMVTKPQLKELLVSEDLENEYTVRRPVYSLTAFDNAYLEEESCHCTQARNLTKETLKSYLLPRNLLKRLLSFLPFLSILKDYYERSFVLGDVLAGITMAIFHIPQGMAYGMLAGLAPINGLYASFYPALLYAFLGTSRHLSLGTFSLICLMIDEPVERLANLRYPDMRRVMNATDEQNSSSYQVLTMGGITDRLTDEEASFRVDVAVCITVLSGLIQMCMGLMHMGFLATYLSDALISGFTTASAVHILTSQLPAIFGLKLPKITGPGKIILIFKELFLKIPQTNFYSVIISAICMLILVIVKDHINPKLKAKHNIFIPVELLLVAGSTTISYFAGFKNNLNVSIIGSIPAGLCLPTLPNLSLWSDVVPDVLVITVVVFALSASISKMYATKFCYEVDYNQELFALGASNVFGGFFHCHMVSGALARTAVACDVGMKSQIASLISCACMLIVLLFVGPLFQTVPTCVLSSIIIISLKGLFMQWREAKVLWRVSIFDFWIWISAFSATVLLDVEYGLVVGFVFALFTVIFRTQVPKSRILGRMPYTDIYEDIVTHKLAAEIPYMKIFRFDGPLYFANADHFRHSLFRMTGVNPNEILKARAKAAAALQKKKKKTQPPAVRKKSDPSEKNVEEVEEVEKENAVTSESDQTRRTTLVPATVTNQFDHFPGVMDALLLSEEEEKSKMDDLEMTTTVETNHVGEEVDVKCEDKSKESSIPTLTPRHRDACTQADEFADLERRLSVVPSFRRPSSTKTSGIDAWADRSLSVPTEEEEDEADEEEKFNVGRPSSTADGQMPIEYIIIDCSSFSYIDSVGVRILKEVVNEFRRCGCKVFLAQCKVGVRHMFIRAGFYNNVNKDFMFLTVHDAVLAALKEHQDVRQYVQTDTQYVRGIPVSPIEVKL